MRPSDHDASYKLLFCAPELVRDLVLGFIPDAWLHSLDYSTLQKRAGVKPFVENTGSFKLYTGQ